ncbi:hypothetical protein BAE44_0019342 [Dichanthelium oligosanthes]|uniref:TF-B3 domain-containing protein n=1 Tax=Dichanthelium oligosanthes TaxID=888268 RepID=A0A1E5V3B4_9POAL|nr:hypothetical protein BAE44_0019342 [Dichanthelium oligosanthes]
MSPAAAGGLGEDAGLAGLRDVLAALGATAPRLVYAKKLNRSDVIVSQARLLIPCRGASDGDDGDARGLTAFLAADEKNRVRAGRGLPFYLQGMEVLAFDRHGRRFGMTLGEVRSIRGGCYRLFGGGWGHFVGDNQLAEALAAAKEAGRELEVELWAFRSAELRLPGRRRAEAADQHPDGALGVAILIRNRG